MGEGNGIHCETMGALFGEARYSPEERLWIAVILQAVKDYTNPENANATYKTSTCIPKIKREAERFITGQNPQFHLACEMLNLEPKTTTEKIMIFIEAKPMMTQFSITYFSNKLNRTNLMNERPRGKDYE